MDRIAKVFKPACQITVILHSGKQVPLKLKDGEAKMVPLFESNENIIGQILLNPASGKKVEFKGIKVELLGRIEMLSGSRKSYDFISYVHNLGVVGKLYDIKTYPFEFSAVEMPHGTYNGIKVKLRYILKVTMSRTFGGNIVEDQEIVVRKSCPDPSINDRITMEFRHENYFHAEVVYNKSMYHLKDVIIGNIYFHHVGENFRIKSMHIDFQRREFTNSDSTLPRKIFQRMVGNKDDPNDPHVEKTTLQKFDVKDGAPIIGESIPIRLVLSSYESTPTMENIDNRFSVKYYLKLVLANEDGLLYSKIQEITMYRLIDDCVTECSGISLM